MYLNQSMILEAINKLGAIHPFYMLTYLVCKRDAMPVGQTFNYDISTKEKEFLDLYFKPVDESKHYFKISRLGRKEQFWIDDKYASSTAQSYRTRGLLSEAFIHERNTKQWGWQTNFLQILRKKLDQDQVEAIPAIYLAIWLYRGERWAKANLSLVLDTFFQQFKISEEEKQEIFDIKIPENEQDYFDSSPAEWQDVQDILQIPLPEDIPASTGGILDFLELKGIGPARRLKIDFFKRTNLITGDNGLGKTFILECAWWALSGEWTGFPIIPRTDAKKNEPEISFGVSKSSYSPAKQTAKYDFKLQDWHAPPDRKTIPGLIIYARVDGAFAIWDPSRTDSTLNQRTARSLILSRDDVWEGLSIKVGHGQTKFLCNGLIEDWVLWQNNPETGVFDTLKRVLKRLSPPEHGDLGLLEPDVPIRVPGSGTKLIPTIRHPYAERIPLTQASAAIRRIAALAYLIVWAWEEHKEQSLLIREKPQNKMVILIDEIESHLHPQWQRVILPALLDIQEALEASIDIQFIITTHSPLVLASLEPFYDPERDVVFHLNLVQKNSSEGTVQLDRPEFVFGTVDSWLRSDFFEMKHARNIKAEEAIEDAKKLQGEENVSQEEVREVSQRLLKYLGAHDSFWPRWIYFAKNYGVEL